MTIRRWTESETQYLLDNCGILSNLTISKRLNRTPKAIRNRLHKLGVSISDNFYSARLLASELGRDKETVMQWYRKGWLKGKVADWGRGYLHSPMVFLEHNIVAFLRKFHHLFDCKKIPNPYFRNVVLEMVERDR